MGVIESFNLLVPNRLLLDNTPHIYHNKHLNGMVLKSISNKLSQQWLFAIYLQAV